VKRLGGNDGEGTEVHVQRYRLMGEEVEPRRYFIESAL
jgi:hypothetical protein